MKYYGSDNAELDRIYEQIIRRQIQLRCHVVP
jgi:hypothetical protein